MPKGVICGGAVDGSNQLGAIVTCQAMTTSPGPGCPAACGVAARSRTVEARAAPRPREERKDTTPRNTPMCASMPGGKRSGWWGDGSAPDPKESTERQPATLKATAPHRDVPAPAGVSGAYSSVMRHEGTRRALLYAP